MLAWNLLSAGMAPTRISRNQDGESSPRHPAPAAAPRLAPGARLIEESGIAYLLLVDGEKVRLNDRAASLLARCDGSLSMDALASHAGNREDTLAFLAVAIELHWLVMH